MLDLSCGANVKPWKLHRESLEGRGDCSGLVEASLAPESSITLSPACSHVKGHLLQLLCCTVTPQGTEPPESRSQGNLFPTLFLQDITQGKVNHIWGEGERDTQTNTETDRDRYRQNQTDR